MIPADDEETGAWRIQLHIKGYKVFCNCEEIFETYQAAHEHAKKYLTKTIQGMGEDMMWYRIISA